MTSTATRAAYRARINQHRSCGIRTNSPILTTCQRCDMVDAYRARREQYLDECEDADPATARKIRADRPITLRAWLTGYEYGPRATVTALPDVEPDVDWAVWAA